MKPQPCVVCESLNYLGAFSTHINDKRVVVCGRCSQAIRGVSEDEIRDRQYDDLMGALVGRKHIVINVQRSRNFDLSSIAQIEYATRLGIDYSLVDREDRHATQTKGRYVSINGDIQWCKNLRRDDNVLVEVVRDLEEYANGDCRLKIITVPADIEWQIESLDGEEWVVERHRVWY